MRIYIRIVSFLLLSGSIFLFASCSSNKTLTEKRVQYFSGNDTLQGFLVYDNSVQKPRPAVLVVHEWWGLNDYARMRARKLAELGYIAFAVDMYGNGKTAENPVEAGKLAGVLYQDPTIMKERMKAALEYLLNNQQLSVTKMAAIGYCFGGSVVLNAAKMGLGLDGVVSFHGGLKGVVPDKSTLKARILVCHGGNDQFVSPAEIDTFRSQLDAIGANYTFKIYPDATHAFTNPDATTTGKKFNLPIEYNAAADTASWKDMQQFLEEVLGKPLD